MEQEQYLEFEKPIAELESKIEGLRRLSATEDGVNIAEEIARLQKKVEKQAEQLYSKLTPWQKTQVARHPDRPHCLDYINALITDFELLAGDRLFGEDEAIVGGVGRFQGYSVVVIGQEKGHDIETRLKHSFGMAKPEGYRKAIRLMKLADRFGLPIITFVDTAGLSPDWKAKNAVRRKRLRLVSTHASAFAFPSSASLSAKADRAARLRLPRRTAS